ncbi:MAG TPA: PPOX class F420-dependent oxidoreductase, partial [Ktedonobacterales bacterium]|nr:PPOX class F420-dependent oxidoreductase [Ktedonobacterales bacterium]
VATVRADGRPHVAPVWFALDGDTIVFNTGEATVKGRNLRRDPRVSISVDDETPPFSFLLIDGTATISSDPDELREWAGRIGGRYMGADRAEEYGARNGVDGELIVRVTPSRVIFEKDLAE